MSEQQDAQRVKTGEMVLSYPFLHTPQPERDDQGNVKPGGKLTFSAALIGFDKTPAETLAQLKAAAYAAAIAKFGASAKEKIEEGSLKWPFRKDVKDKKYDKVGGIWFISARTQKRPGLVDRVADPKTGKAREIIGIEEIEKFFYPGAHVRATVRAYGFANKSKGVTFALDNIQYLGEGTRLDNRVEATDDFEADLAQAPAAIDDLL